MWEATNAVSLAKHISAQGAPPAREPPERSWWAGWGRTRQHQRCPRGRPSALACTLDSLLWCSSPRLPCTTTLHNTPLIGQDSMVLVTQWEYWVYWRTSSVGRSAGGGAGRACDDVLDRVQPVRPRLLRAQGRCRLCVHCHLHLRALPCDLLCYLLFSLHRLQPATYVYNRAKSPHQNLSLIRI